MSIEVLRIRFNSSVLLDVFSVLRPQRKLLDVYRDKDKSTERPESQYVITHLVREPLVVVRDFVPPFNMLYYVGLSGLLRQWKVVSIEVDVVSYGG